MRNSIYDSVKLIGAASIIQSVAGSSAINGAGIDTIGMTDAVLRASVSVPGGGAAPTAASLVFALQESSDSATWTAALDNTSTAIGFTLAPLIGATGNLVSGSNIITSMSSIAGINVGAIVYGTGLAASLGAVVTAILSTTSIQVSRNATSAQTGTTLSFSTDGEARIEGLGLNRKRYLRAVVTPTYTGGTTPACAVIAEIVQGGPPYQLPVPLAVSNT
jgi:hypothetical protein